MRTLLAFVILLSLSACYKLPDQQIDNSAPQFKVSSYTPGQSLSATVNMLDSSVLPMSFNFTLISGNPSLYPVTCYITGLPTGITCSPDSSTFRLNNNVSFTLTAQNTAHVTDTICLNIISAFYGHQKVPLILKILPPYDCSADLIGTYHSNDPCGHFSFGSVWSGDYAATIDSISGLRHWVSITNLRGLGDSIVVNASVQCYPDNYITIPRQTVHGYTISGRGTYNYEEAIIYDTIIHAGDTQTCISQLQR